MRLKTGVPKLRSRVKHGQTLSCVPGTNLPPRLGQRQCECISVQQMCFPSNGHALWSLLQVCAARCDPEREETEVSPAHYKGQAGQEAEVLIHNHTTTGCQQHSKGYLRRCKFNTTICREVVSTQRVWPSGGSVSHLGSLQDHLP